MLTSDRLRAVGTDRGDVAAGSVIQLGPDSAAKSRAVRESQL